MTEQGEARELLAADRSPAPAMPASSAIGVGNEVNRPLLRANGRRCRRTGGVHLAGRRLRASGPGVPPQAHASGREQCPDRFRRRGGVRRRAAQTAQPVPRRAGAAVRPIPRRRRGESRPSAATCWAARSNRSVALHCPKTDGGNPEIERMWAWHRVHRLLNEADRTGSRSGVIDEIVGFGRRRIRSSRNTRRSSCWRTMRSTAVEDRTAQCPASGRDRRSQQDVHDQLDRLRQQAMNNLGPTAAPTSTDTTKPQLAQADPTDTQTRSQQTQQAQALTSSSVRVAWI